MLWICRISLLGFIIVSTMPTKFGQLPSTDTDRRPVDVDGLFRQVDLVAIVNGYSPTPTMHSRCLQAIVCSSNAPEELSRLYGVASPEGKILILMALHRVDRPTYDSLRKDFERTRVPARRIAWGHIAIGEDEFDVMTGACSPDRMAKRDVLASLDNGSFEALLPWACR